ncbi:unnamed protein product [Rhizophagus irregularis]|uniref:Uncharacterized protein n=1 Tax=Rhizophagus irregularis TaxID=588596 RepID=A0A915ZRJ9_9GLOM|nr:unnamed protein product [Rhizophagus irregularis]
MFDQLYCRSLLVDLYVSWNRMYIFSRKETFSDPELNDFQCNTFRIITSSTSAKKHRQTSTLSGIKESFLLSDFNEFINEYKATHHLAQEDEKAFDILIEALNQYFDFIEGINDDDVKATLIKWYTNASIGIDTVHANTKYYN